MQSKIQLINEIQSKLAKDYLIATRITYLCQSLNIRILFLQILEMIFALHTLELLFSRFLVDECYDFWHAYLVLEEALNLFFKRHLLTLSEKGRFQFVYF